MQCNRQDYQDLFRMNRISLDNSYIYVVYTIDIHLDHNIDNLYDRHEL
jgi:hypothetical protein